MLFATTKTRFRPKTGFPSSLSIKVDREIKNIPIDATFDIDSKAAIKNIIAPRNVDVAFENRFSFLPSEGRFLFRRKGYLSKMTSKMKSAHKKDDKKVD